MYAIWLWVSLQSIYYTSILEKIYIYQIHKTISCCLCSSFERRSSDQTVRNQCMQLGMLRCILEVYICSGIDFSSFFT